MYYFDYNFILVIACLHRHPSADGGGSAMFLALARNSIPLVPNKIATIEINTAHLMINVGVPYMTSE
jgi:hypothetical protein